ncbi:MAG: ribose-phosphate diphosphokinase [Bernardetiaceae bacterium]|jgi:ribose-phosphate pyrophosphokinase|nr:ribose-phosphate diphosphokinase [Bernardetiaceae bacterium]
MSPPDTTVLFSTRSYAYLREQLLATGHYEAGLLEARTFPDGEHYYRIGSSLEYREVVLLGGTISDADTLELYDLACGIVELGARKLHLVIPFYGYATMERASKTGEVVTAKTRARLLSAVPQAYFGNRVLCLDLHSEGIPHYFEGGIRPLHVYAKPLITHLAQQLAGPDFVMASTDAGRAKWVESLANDLGVPAAFVYKRRLSGSQTQLTGVNADVRGKTVVLYDDMIRTGGSLLQAAQAYHEAGAARLLVLATHGLFNNQAAERLQKSQLIEKVVVTDSHPNALAAQSPFVQVTSVAQLLHQALLGVERPMF